MYKINIVFVNILNIKNILGVNLSEMFLQLFRYQNSFCILYQIKFFPNFQIINKVGLYILLHALIKRLDLNPGVFALNLKASFLI